MASRPPAAELPVRAFRSPAQWEAWLRRNHSFSGGLWLRIAKKDAGISSVTYAEALEAALCYGWIDGQKQKGDASTWLQKFTPRGPRSGWSRINREKAEALIESGRMRAPGLAAVERARRNGQWDSAYESPSRATVPEDLRKALSRNRAARDFFKTLNGANRYAILYRLQTASRPETRARRLSQFIEMLAQGKTLHP